MGSTLYGIDVVYIGVYILAIVRIIHYSDFDWNALLFRFQINYIIKEMCAVTVYVTHEFLESLFGMEHFLTCLAFFIGTHIGKGDCYAGIQICQFPHALCDDVIFI